MNSTQDLKELIKELIDKSLSGTLNWELRYIKYSEYYFCTNDLYIFTVQKWQHDSNDHLTFKCEENSEKLNYCFSGILNEGTELFNTILPLYNVIARIVNQNNSTFTTNNDIIKNALESLKDLSS